MQLNPHIFPETRLHPVIDDDSEGIVGSGELRLAGRRLGGPGNPIAALDNDICTVRRLPSHGILEVHRMGLL